MENNKKQLQGQRLFYFKIILLVYFLWVLAFAFVNTNASTLPSRDLTSWLDKQIPVLPQFIWFYDFCFALPFFSIFILKDWHRFNRMLLSFVIANFTAFFTYLCFPTGFLKPELGTSIADRFLLAHYGANMVSGSNNFPSMHVSFAWLFFFMCRKQRLGKKGDGALLILTVFITISTLFVKLHLVADVLAGILWAFVSWFLAKRFYPYLASPELEAPAALRQMARKSLPAILMSVTVILSIASLRRFLDI